MLVLRTHGRHTEAGTPDNKSEFQHFLWKKPTVQLSVKELSNDRFTFNSLTFPSKTQAQQHYLTDHFGRLQNLMSDFNKLTQGTRIDDVPIDVQLFDRNPKENNPNYYYTDQKDAYLSAKKPLGHMKLMFETVDEKDAELKEIRVRGLIHSPRTLVHEMAHTIDVAYGGGDIISDNLTKNPHLYRSHNDPTFQPICNAYKQAMVEQTVKFAIQRGSDMSMDQAQRLIDSDKQMQNYYFQPTEIHSRLFEQFYAIDIEPYRELNDYNKAHVYDGNHPQYGIPWDVSAKAARQVYMEHPDLAQDWFKRHYADILPDNHPEYTKYTGVELDPKRQQEVALEQEQVFTNKTNYYKSNYRISEMPTLMLDKFDQTPAPESAPATNNANSNSLSDQQLLENLRQAEQKHLPQSSSQPSVDASYEL